MAETLGYYAGARPGTPDADILDRIEEQFGSWLQELTRDDKATVLICLVERVTDPQQVFIEENFFSDANGGELWQLAQNLTPPFQLGLASAIMSYLVDGGRG